MSSLLSTMPRVLATYDAVSRDAVGQVGHRVDQRLVADRAGRLVAGHDRDDRREVAAGAVAHHADPAGVAAELGGVLGRPPQASYSSPRPPPGTGASARAGSRPTPRPRRGRGPRCCSSSRTAGRCRARTRRRGSSPPPGAGAAASTAVGAVDPQRHLPVRGGERPALTPTPRWRRPRTSAGEPPSGTTVCCARRRAASSIRATEPAGLARISRSMARTPSGSRAPAPTRPLTHPPSPICPRRPARQPWST